MADKFRLNVLTPERSIFEGVVATLQASGRIGDFGVLIGMFIATDPTTRGTALKPLPMVLDIWVGVVAPAAWLVVKFYLAHVLPRPL